MRNTVTYSVLDQCSITNHIRHQRPSLSDGVETGNPRPEILSFSRTRRWGMRLSKTEDTLEVPCQHEITAMFDP